MADDDGDDFPDLAIESAGLVTLHLWQHAPPFDPTCESDHVVGVTCFGFAVSNTIPKRCLCRCVSNGRITHEYSLHIERHTDGTALLHIAIGANLPACWTKQRNDSAPCLALHTSSVDFDLFSHGDARGRGCHGYRAG